MTRPALSDCDARRWPKGAIKKRNANVGSRFPGEDEPAGAVSVIVEHVLRRLGIGDYAIRCGVRFVHAPDMQCAITDLDVVVVTPFGMFIVCVMSFQGSVEPGPDAQTLIVAKGDSAPRLHTSPVRRHAAVLRALRALLSAPACPVESLAVNAATPCQIHPLLPDSILMPDELYHYFRIRLLRFFETKKPHVVVSRIVDLIESKSEAMSAES